MASLSNKASYQDLVAYLEPYNISIISIILLVASDVSMYQKTIILISLFYMSSIWIKALSVMTLSDYVHASHVWPSIRR